MTRTLFSGIVGPLALATSTAGGELEISGSAGTEMRAFAEAPAFDEQGTARAPSMTIEPQLIYEWTGDGVDRITVRPFLRLDGHDSNRTHWDLRELGWLHLGRSWVLHAGLGKVFWGVTESRHLVDVINQTDGVEDVDGEDKLGQPMVSLTLETRFGAFELFWLPLFRERTFPARDARLRGPLPILEDASYESPAGKWHQDWAVRWARPIGPFDVGVAHVRGTSREPRFLLDAGPDGPALRPRYDLVDQTSLDVQWTTGEWLWKLEAMTRSGHGDRFAAAVAGFEYTLFQVFPGSADLGLLAEWLYDGRGADAPPTVFDHDLFVGFRWALNDVKGTAILGGPIVDYETGEVIALLEAQRRLAASWLLEVEGRGFFRTTPASPAHGLRRDHHLTVRLTRFF